MDKKKTISFRLKTDTYNKLVEIAKDQELSVSDIIRMVIKETFKERKQDNDSI